MQEPKHLSQDNYVVKSRTTDEEYHVRAAGVDGKGECTCRGWQFTYSKKRDLDWTSSGNGRQPFHCPHILAAWVHWNSIIMPKFGEQFNKDKL